MKSLWTGLLPLLALGVASAHAESPGDRGSIKDGPYATPFSWAGPYIGAHLGGAWGRQTVTTPEDSSLSIPNDPNANVFGGLQAGYNWQYGNVVLGVEANFGQMLLSHSANLIFAGGSSLFGVDQGDGLYGSLTGRLGYAFGRSLAYAKGGFAVFDGEGKVSLPLGPVFGSTTSTFTGWTIGGGLEYALTPAWSFAVEYQHFNFGDERSVFEFLGGARFDHSLSVDSVKFGLNYRFGH